jgi:hypothetical protein
MVFGSLFKPKGKLVLQAPDNSLPGRPIPIDVQLTAEEEIKPNGVRVELIGEETYYKTEFRRDSKGSTHPHTVEKNEPFASIVQVIAEQPSIAQGVEQKWNCFLQLPADAPCTCRGKIVNIRWILKAVVDVPKRADLSQEKPFHILCLAPQPGGVALLPAEKSFGEVTLSLKAAPSVVAGSTLKGQLILQIKEKLSIRGIRIELVQAEVAGTRTSDEIIVKAQIAGESTFTQYESPSFDFSLDIPAEVPPTATCKHSSLRWKVRAVIDRKMKTDFNVEQELLLYHASKA